MSEVRARRLHVVRHGETERSAQHAYSGQADVPLTETGRKQARQAAERLASEGVDGVVSSPLVRASDTARAIAEVTGAPLEIDDRLIEVDYGPLEGLNREKGREQFGEAFTAWREDPFGAPLEGMETLDDGLERARAATADALASYEHPVLVAHQAILRLVLVALGQVEPDEYFSIRLTEAEPLEIEAPALVSR